MMLRRTLPLLAALTVALASVVARERHTREEADAHELGNVHYEIVVARHTETDLAWLGRIPLFYKLTIYNKGGEGHKMPDPPEGQHWTVVDLPNIGREANTFAEHLVRRYETLADYTIFSQADPFVHNRWYLELLRSPALLGSVQAMSRLYKRDGDERFKTPEEAVVKMSRHPWYRSERVSTRTLNSVWYHDEGTVHILRTYLAEHKLAPGTNLIRHHFSLMGLPDWVPEEQEVASFAFGGLVGFERSRALQHPKHCYQALLNTTRVDGRWSTAWMIERMWLVMFGGPSFRDI